jgi:aspartate-semialdehyde dehydrogenase
MPLPSNYCRVAIVGASSLRGKDLSAALEERGFPATDMRLLDDEVVDGTLTESGGEPLVIQGIDEESFDAVRFAFLAGDYDLGQRHWQQAARAGATVIDLGGPLAAEPSATTWIPALRRILPAVAPSPAKLFYSPPAPALIACTLAAGLQAQAIRRMAITFFQPVSELGQEGIEELESQTVSLLSMKPFSTSVFDGQVAFNLLGAYGQGSRQGLSRMAEEAARDARRFLEGRGETPALQIVQAPVFYGYSFSAYVECADAAEPGVLERALESAGIKVSAREEDFPNNVSVAGESVIRLAPVAPDSNVKNAFWLWGAADNLRLASANAISIAETLLAS